ncbi:MAG: MFS transporter [Gammaproteobacteria bacterium]|nr:MFS transporter [Gammaproteobacteria bacterium]
MDQSAPDKRRLPPGIWLLGMASLFMDASSELVHSLLPVFMASVLGASMLTIGIIEGVAEATVAITKVFSGALSDYLRHRKWIVVFGYSLAAFTKPMFPLAQSIAWVFGARFIDRVGKGIRGAPRDALIADITPPELRGAAYGLRQALDSIGAVIGPLLAVGLMIWLVNDIRSVLWVAVIPAFIAVALLLFLREPGELAAGPAAARWSAAGAGMLPARFWVIVSQGGVFTLARFSEAFLILRAQDVGLALGQVPWVLVIMSLSYALFAYPAGAAADRMNHRFLLLVGIAPLVAADLVLATADSAMAVWVGCALWGLHMAFTQGLFAKLVADVAPQALRGTAFGIFNLATGAALLLASVIAGGLWTAYGPALTFWAGAGFATLAGLGVLVTHSPRRS